MKRFIVIVAPPAGGIAHFVYALSDNAENAAAYAKGLTGNEIIVQCQELPPIEADTPAAPQPQA